MGSAGERWAEALAGWAIPRDILDAAPESPWGFPRSLFGRTKDQVRSSDNPSHRRALEALPAGGTVLDVGVGGGAASLPLASRAARIVGVDESMDLLETFAASADELGIEHEEFQGTWPDIAGRVAPADVVVCHHVFYNAPELAGFALALTQHARGRVVVEMTSEHPATALKGLWMEFHGLERPDGPTAEDAVDVLREAGIEPEVHRWSRPRDRTAPRSEVIAFVRRRLCLSQDHDARLDELLGPEPIISPRRVATMWWPGTAG